MLAIQIVDFSWAKGRRYGIMASVKMPQHLIPLSYFLIDTGSPYTFISQSECEMMRINLNNCKTFERMDIARSQVELKDLGTATFNFHVGNDTLASFSYKALGGSSRSAGYYPSILGRDFLEEFNLGISRRRNDGHRYLEFETEGSKGISVRRF